MFSTSSKKRDPRPAIRRAVSKARDKVCSSAAVTGSGGRVQPETVRAEDGKIWTARSVERCESGSATARWVDKGADRWAETRVNGAASAQAAARMRAIRSAGCLTSGYWTKTENRRC